MSLDIITSEIPVKDGCPALTHVKMFKATLGEEPTLEHVFRDKQGRPLDLSAYFSSGSDSDVESDTQIEVRLKEVISPAASGCNPLWQLTGQIVTPAAGVAHIELEKKVIPAAGIYQLNVALKQGAKILKVDTPYLWIDRSLFGDPTYDPSYLAGPPTLEEIRNRIYDSGASDNFLLNDVEFTDSQIAQAICHPVQLWNETTPQIDPFYDSRSFPYPEHWLKGICASLFMTAAHNYRRNSMPTNAGGIAITDKEKEVPYLRMAQQLQQEYRDWMIHAKVEINTSRFGGIFGSSYG